MKTQGRTQSSNIEDRRGNYDDEIGKLIVQNAGYKPTPTWTRESFPTVKNIDDFLIDTFKRARSSGFPMHPLDPYFNARPSDKFTKEEFDY